MGILDNLPETSADKPGHEVVDPSIPEGDHAIVVIRRHPFGLVVLVLEVILGVALGLGLLFLLLPTASGSAGVRHALALVSVLLIALAAIFLVIMAALYRDNRWIVTDDSIVQVLRIGLFKIKTAALSMANIEDVSSDRNGIFAQIFGFGTLKCETAGEKSDFHFVYCPKPDTFAHIILDARERFINDNPSAAKRANPLLEVPRSQ